MSVIGIAFGTTQDKIKDYGDKKRRGQIDVFSNKEIKTLDDYFRSSFGSPGETARVLTKSYYSMFFQNKTKTKENLLALLHHRNNALSIQGIGLDLKLLEELATKCSGGISLAIFAIVIYENSFQNNNSFTKANFGLIHKIVSEEHNKLAPHQYQEYYIYSDFNFLSTKYLFEKYGIDLIKNMDNNFIKK